MESPINPTKLVFTRPYQHQHHTTVKDKLRELHWFADDTLRVNKEMDKLNIVDPAKIAGYVKNASAFLRERYPKLDNEVLVGR